MKKLSESSEVKFDSIEGKGLEPYNTVDKTAEAFFETGSPIRSAILIAEGTLYMGNKNCEFYAVDFGAKQQRWMIETDAPVLSLPVLVDGKIVFNAGGGLYILDAASGRELAKITYPADAGKQADRESYYYHDSRAAVSGGAAYFVAQNGDLVAADVGSRAIAWTFPAAVRGPAGSGVNVYNGRIYWCNAAGVICCVDIAARREIFRTQIDDKIFAPMLIDGGRIYAAGRSARIFCIDADEGDILWYSYSHDKTTWFSGGSVCVGANIYACTSDEHTLVSFKKDSGEFQRIYPTGTNAYTAPAVHGDNVIVAAADVYSFNQSYIMEFDTINHTKLWEAELPCCVLSSPAVYGDAVYFGSDLGIVYSINLK